jgi:glycosyltransferase involved in cell wall biosynthesis
MKMVYIFKNNIFDDKYVGVVKKVGMQLEALKKYGYEPILFIYDGRRVYVCDKVTGEYKIEYFESLQKSLEFILKSIDEIKPKFIYARHIIFYTHYIFEFYNQLCSKNENVIYEFYTFPYDNEFKEGDKGLKADKYYRKKIKDFIKITTNYNEFTEILGIPSIPLNNGIDLEKISVKRNIPKKKINCIEMIGIATLWFWHGYDRVIEGLNQYYNSKENKYEIKFNIVGEGKETERLKNLVDKYGLQKYVIFHGKLLDSHLLQQLRQESDIAIGSLGLHRLKLTNVSTIKAPEYCAAGIPFIISYNEISFKEPQKFILNVEPNDNPLCIEEVIKFYENNIGYETSLKMRKYAENNLTWKTIMGKVLECAGLK